MRAQLPVDRSIRAFRPRTSSVHEHVVATARSGHLRLIVAIARVARDRAYINRNEPTGGVPMNRMKVRRKHLEVAAAVAAAVAALGATSAAAQDIKVEVTGSNIRRVEGEGALPVQVLTREDIAKTGATNPMELLQYISANNTAGNVSLGNTIGSTTFGNQTASLRGLGGSSTLVLVNGKRLGTFAG